MITAPDNSWRYCGPPRTGGTYLHQLLQKPPLNGIYSGHQHDASPLFGGRVIVSVRNPFDRAVSLWRHFRYQQGLVRIGRHGNDERIVPLEEGELSFRSFLERMCSLEDFYHLSMSSWLQDLRKIDCVVHLENFWPEICKAWPQLQAVEPPMLVNTSGAASFRNAPFGDRWCVDYICKRWRGDFERFGYSPTVPFDLAFTPGLS